MVATFSIRDAGDDCDVLGFEEGNGEIDTVHAGAGYIYHQIERSIRFTACKSIYRANPFDYAFLTLREDTHHIFAVIFGATQCLDSCILTRKWGTCRYVLLQFSHSRDDLTRT